MFWKYHIINKFGNNTIYFKCKIIYQIIIFLLKKDIYLLYFFFFKKKYNIEASSNNFNEVEIYLRKSVRNYMRKIFYSQLKITKYNTWLILFINLFSTDSKKNITKNKSNESYLRYRHIYNYLSPNQLKITMINKVIKYISVIPFYCVYYIFITGLFFEYITGSSNFITNIIPVDLLINFITKYIDIEKNIYSCFLKIYFYFLNWAIIYCEPLLSTNLKAILYIIFTSKTSFTFHQFYTIISFIIFLLSLTIWTRAAGPRVRLDQLSNYVFKKSTPLILFIILIIIIYKSTK